MRIACFIFIFYLFFFFNLFIFFLATIRLAHSQLWLIIEGEPVRILILWTIVRPQLLWYYGITCINRDSSKTRLPAKFSRKKIADVKTQSFTFSYKTFYIVYTVSLYIHSLQTSASNFSGLGGWFLWFKSFNGSV